MGYPQHERGSVDMLRFMLEDNKIDLSAFDPPLCAKDVTFIEEMILGTPPNDRNGRGTDKEFLYDIINNTRSGLDVDKLDYFKRDARNSVGERSVNLDRFIELARCCCPLTRACARDNTRAICMRVALCASGKIFIFGRN